MWVAQSDFACCLVFVCVKDKVCEVFGGNMVDAFHCFLMSLGGVCREYGALMLCV